MDADQAEERLSPVAEMPVDVGGELALAAVELALSPAANGHDGRTTAPTQVELLALGALVAEPA